MVIAMDWPSNEDCYHAMKAFVTYYMEGEQHNKWLSVIEDGLKTGRFPPGKGFLHEIDKVMKDSAKPAMPRKAELYRLICTVCI